MDGSITINVKVNAHLFRLIKQFIDGKINETDKELVTDFLKEVYDTTFEKAAFLEELGSSFITG